MEPQKPVALVLSTPPALPGDLPEDPKPHEWRRLREDWDDTLHTSTPTSPFASLPGAPLLARPRSAAGGQRPVRRPLQGGSVLDAVWRIREEDRGHKLNSDPRSPENPTPEAARTASPSDSEGVSEDEETDRPEALTLEERVAAKPAKPANPADPEQFRELAVVALGGLGGLGGLGDVEDLTQSPQCPQKLPEEDSLLRPREKGLERQSLEDEASSHQAWEQHRADWGWSCPGRPEEDRKFGERWPWLQEESADADCADCEPCSPRPGTRLGGRRNKAARAEEAEATEGQGWADFVQTWDGSDSEEEQLFAVVGQNATISAQELLSVDDPEPELEGFVPRDLWVVFECDEEEELSDQADTKNSQVDRPREFCSDAGDIVWTISKASETDDTADTECMSSLAPTECEEDEEGMSDDDEDHQESKVEVGTLHVQQGRRQAQTASQLDGSQNEGKPGCSSVLLIQAVCQGYLIRSKLLRLSDCAASGRPQRVSAETARARARRDEVSAAMQLQAAWRGFRAQVTRPQGRAERRPPGLGLPPFRKAPRRRGEMREAREAKEVAVQDLGASEEPLEESERSQELRPRPSRRPSKGSSASDRPPSAPRGSALRRRRRPELQDASRSVASAASSAGSSAGSAGSAGGLPRLGLMGSRHSDNRPRHRPAPASNRAPNQVKGSENRLLVPKGLRSFTVDLCNLWQVYALCRSFGTASADSELLKAAPRESKKAQSSVQYASNAQGAQCWAEMMRPPSREDVQTAQSHLVLLKSKMRQRRQQASVDNLVDPRGRPPSGRAPAEKVPRGVTWDPPSAPVKAAGKPDVARPMEDGYPGHPTPSQARVPAKSPPNSGRTMPQSANSLVDDGPDDDGGPLVPCPDCGRSFKAESLEKHKKICKKVFQQKRKQFNSAANRLGDLDNASELIANASRIDKQKEAPKEADKTSKKDKTVPKWKAQSLAFRQAILAAKGASGDPEAARKAEELQKELIAANPSGMESDMVRCPHCGRTFNKEAGQRHIAICLKTFGNKLGRQTKGSGRPAAKPSTPTSRAPDPSARGAMVRGPSASRKSGQSGRHGGPETTGSRRG
ncbi:zc2hc1a [Symbiodinium pilosum]|uniref:Zc2hc1a protein n=1 Tax=Symbiodinium pilosum TaxID=2952 RepID=A0A812S0M0_SYMPI|nr:zc2hc1a [Symbiodinium pilosum]